MKAGRPKNRIKAFWVSFIQNKKEIFYELDKYGNLVSRKPHHVNNLENSTYLEDRQKQELPVDPLPLPIISDNSDSNTSSQNILQEQLENQMDNFFENDENSYEFFEEEFQPNDAMFEF